MRFFLSLVARAVKREWIEVHCFAVLRTHFHLLVRTRNRGISDSMSWIQSRYVMRFNWLHNRDGPLVRNRFFSKRVRDAGYRRVLFGYIDWNPVDAGLVDRPTDYPHGSAIRLVRRRPKWLSSWWLERHVFGGDIDPATYCRMLKPTEKQVDAIEFGSWHRSTRPCAEEARRARDQGVERWLRMRARVADGDARRLQRVVPPDSVERHLESADLSAVRAHLRPNVHVEDLVKVILLRVLSALPFREIAGRIGVAPSRAHRLWELHCRKAVDSAAYREACARVVDGALAIVLPPSEG